MEYYIILVILILLLVFLFLTFYKKKFSKKDEKFIILKLKDIENMILKDNYNQSIIELDKLLDFFLSKKGYKGNTGKKLKNYKSKYINDLWYIHKLRNKIAHEMNFNISKKEAYKAIDIFKKILHESNIKLID